MHTDSLNGDLPYAQPEISRNTLLEQFMISKTIEDPVLARNAYKGIRVMLLSDFGTPFGWRNRTYAHGETTVTVSRHRNPPFGISRLPGVHGTSSIEILAQGRRSDPTYLQAQGIINAWSAHVERLS